MEKKNIKLLTATNIFILCCIIVYILNVFVISPDTGYMSKEIIKTLKSMGMETTPITKLGYKIFGTWGGTVNSILGFRLDSFLRGEIWRLFTVVFTHGFLLHIILNMVAMAIIGNKVEKKLGIVKTLILFFVIAAIDAPLSEIIYTLFKEMSGYATGASGSIYGLIGITIMLNYYDKTFWKSEFSKGKTIYIIIYMIFTSFVNLLSGDPYSLIAHIIGLVLGLAIGFFICKPKEAKSEK